MNVNKSSLFWGLLLIFGGGVALAQQFGYFDQLPESAWMWVFAVISLVALVSYIVSGFKEWGWLFPAGIFGGLAVIVGMAVNHMESAAIGSPIFIGLLIPFAAAYLTDRTRNWWALIPGGVMLFLALTTLLVDTIGGEWIGSMILFLIALSFFAVYMNNHSRTWALLVAYIMFIISIAPAMAAGGELAGYYGSVFLIGVAIPFFVLYFRSEQNWWAIIPAGITSLLAVIAGVAVAGLIPSGVEGGYVNAFLMGGVAATFAVVWLRHTKDWAKVVTIVFAALAVASLFFVSLNEIFWPIAIILAGAYLLYTSMRPKMAH